MNKDIAIVGAGVIGMMTARELAKAGVTVTLVDRSQPARESSWAGGGIVSPLYPWRYAEAITALASWSQSSYIQLSEELEEETGISPELRQKGLLMVSVEDQQQALNWADKHQRNLIEVPSHFVYELEPNLPEGIDSALWMADVASIRNPRLGQSLQRSLELNPNIDIISDAEFTSINKTNGSAQSIQTSKGTVSADSFIFACGAWSGEVGAQLGLEIPVQPVKGQMLVIKAEPGFLNRVVLQNGRYLIPRNDGRILVGSTLEFDGFDKTTSEEAAKSLYQSAMEIMPALDQFEIEHQWAGLRPGCPSGVPFIDKAPNFDNVFVNAGHFRNGLVLAPASCRLMADLVLNKQPVINPSHYRFDVDRGEQLI